MTDIAIRRHRYARMVSQLAQQAEQYQSVTVFARAMLNELKQRDDVNLATRAAAATWALHLLSRSTGSGGALEAVAEALLPAVYCHFSVEKLPYAAPAIQTEVRDAQTIRSNPYFTHVMYAEQIDLEEDRVGDMRRALNGILTANDSRRAFVIRTIAARRARTLREVFEAWRTLVRRLRVLSFTTEKRMKRHEVEVARLRLHAVFCQWKAEVELSRNAFLTERLHESASQLENAKNQFQLQCFRAERLLQSEQLSKEELQAALDTNDALRREVDRLQDLLVQREREYVEKLTNHVKEAFQMVYRYRGFTDLLVRTRPPPEKYVSEEQPIASSPTKEMGELTREVGLDGLLSLFRWCNCVLREVQGENAIVIRSAGSDLASGEALLVILRYVFPETAVQVLETNREYRYQKIKEISLQCRLRFVLDADDFTHQREDRLVMTLCEVYTRYIVKRHTQHATQAQADLEQYEAPQVEDGVEVVDEDEFHRLVEDCRAHLRQLEEEVISQSYNERELATRTVAIAVEESRLASERAQGLPLRWVGEASTKAFWKLPPRCLDDLRLPSNRSNADGEPLLWGQVLEASLQTVLSAKVDTTTRLFAFFAGDTSKTMSEVAFWRFVELAPVVDDGFSKEAVGSIFDHVASPQLAAALKSATHGKTEAEVKTLLQVARQEVDVRTISASQFTEVLVRLAVARLAGSCGFVQSVEHFLQTMEKTLRMISKAVPDVLVSFYEPESRSVIRFFCDDLVRVFFFYVKRQESSKVPRERAMATQDGGRFAALMAHSMYLTMLEECGFMATKTATRRHSSAGQALVQPLQLTPDLVQQMLSTLQSSYPNSVSGELTFTTFVESLAALCHYWCPNPFVPPSRKLAAFIAHFINQLNIRHSQSTLVLGLPPEIPLKGGKVVNFAATS